MTTKKDVRITMRCRAFTCEGPRENRLLVETGGAVLAWDDVAGHYTTHHVLGRSAQARARKIAKNNASRELGNGGAK